MRSTFAEWTVMQTFPGAVVHLLLSCVKEDSQIGMEMRVTMMHWSKKYGAVVKKLLAVEC